MKATYIRPKAEISVEIELGDREKEVVDMLYDMDQVIWRCRNQKPKISLSIGDLERLIKIFRAFIPLYRHPELE